MNKYHNFLKKALNEMFVNVGFDQYDENFVKQEEWYSKKTWTNEQSNAFKTWFIKQVRKELRFTKKVAEREYAMFDLMWGWKIQS